MMYESNARKLKQVALLLSHKLLQVYPGCSGDPIQQAVLFFGEIPDALLASREDSLERGERFREWVLVTDESLGSEWLESLRGDYGVDIIYVDNLAATRAELLPEKRADRPRWFRAIGQGARWAIEQAMAGAAL